MRQRTYGDMSCEEEVPSAKMSKVSGRQFELRRSCGILWPVKAFEDKHGRKPKHREVTQITQNGEVVSGVVLPGAYGMPEGGVKIFERNYVSMTQDATLHRS